MRMSIPTEHRKYHTAMTVEKIALSTKKGKVALETGDIIDADLPYCAVTFSIHGEQAALAAASLAAFQGLEAFIDVSGDARQLSLL